MARLLLIFFLLPCSLKSFAQTINDNGQQSTVLANGTYQDFVIPNNPQITKISFFLSGADGGAADLHLGQYIPVPFSDDIWLEAGSYTSGGGAGATVSVTFLVGSTTNKIPLGSTIRFVVGQKGETGTARINVIPDGGTGAEYGGGGGGTAILFRPPTAVANWAYNWHLLAVAGGGGGAYQGVVAGIALGLGDDGGAGRDGENGGDGHGSLDNGEGGSGGLGGGSGFDGAGGGGAFEDGKATNGCIYPWEESNPSAGEGGLGGLTGGHGGTDEGCDNLFESSNGGFGYGGGGVGHLSGGGGGGYSGGGAGAAISAGGGGGSYVNPARESRQWSHGGSTENPRDGFVRYQVTLNQPPVANCKNVTIYLDANGQASLSSSDIDDGSSDPEGEPLRFSLSKSNFTCADAGTNNVTLTVIDNEGATAACTAVVTVADNSNPTVITQNITVYLDATGNATITTADIDNGSYDNCSIDKYELDILSFDCDDLGPNTVTLTLTDVNGNSASNTAIVTVVDNLGPIITSVTPDKVYLWPPNHKMQQINVAIVSTDNCPGNGIACKIIAVSSNEPINGQGDGDLAPDWEITGHNTVNLRAERSGKGSGRIYTITVECADGSGNKTTSTTEVSVSDNSIPITAVRPGEAVAVNKAAALNKQETATVEGLQVNVYPNPAGSHFNIQIKSDNKQEQIKMQVFDVSGRRVEMRNNIAEGSTIQVGGLYLSGAYFLKVQQGYQHKEIKLIKLSE